MSAFACLTPVLFSACVPLHYSERTLAVGCLWTSEATEDLGLRRERVEGIGLSLSAGTLALGWMSIEAATVDPEVNPTGTLRIGNTQFFWGDGSESTVVDLMEDNE